MAQNGQNRSKRVSKMTPFLDPLGPLFSPLFQHRPVPANSSVPHHAFWAEGPKPAKRPQKGGLGTPKWVILDPFLAKKWSKNGPKRGAPFETGPGQVKRALGAFWPKRPQKRGPFLTQKWSKMAIFGSKMGSIFEPKSLRRVA